MTLRIDFIKRAPAKPIRHSEESVRLHSLQFGSKVFSLRIMEQVLSKKVFQNIMNVIEGREKFDVANADAIALALKDWALKEGATHFTHWFQPLSGAFTEKHDSFLTSCGKGSSIESFKGSDLLKGEPDASSFPSGQLRSTHQARGYTTWDLVSFPFIWERANGATLCIPALFFSYNGHALDYKLPLLRSIDKINAALLRLCRLCDVQASRIFPTLAFEQDYFLIDRSFALQRPDLLLTGRTIYGAPSAKGCDLEDHYFGPVKDRVIDFMREFEEEALRLGIPIKTRHNALAPAQHEVSCLFEDVSGAVDHNLLLMELMRQIAINHNLACLFHEKPFAGFNGSGKHCLWSLRTDNGLNLLDPKKNSLLFLILLTATLRAVHDHAGLMRASIGSSGNDLRLEESQAPSAVLSVYLGEELEAIIDDLIQEKSPRDIAVRSIDLGLSHLSAHIADASDRNQSSFFAFTGNQFELRAVGAAAHIAFPITVLNAIVADAVHLILDEIGDVLQDRVLTQQQLFIEALPCLRKHLIIAKPILFGGNSHSLEWEKEAQRRGLPNIRKSFHAFSQLLDKRALHVFQGILSEEELQCRYEVLVERYAKTIQIETDLMIELFRTQILPAALQDQMKRAASLKNLSDLSISPPVALMSGIEHFAKAIEDASMAVDKMEVIQKQSENFGWEAKGKAYSEILVPKMEEARIAVDRLERLMDDTLWILPKFREMLYIL